MKKHFILHSILASILIGVFGYLSVQLTFAQSCRKPGDTCSVGQSSQDKCCTPVNNVIYSCAMDTSKSTGQLSVFTCQKSGQQPGQTNCTKQGDSCSSTSQCCFASDGKTALICNDQLKCELPTANQCADEGQDCLGNARTNCCDKYNDKKEKLQCLDSSNNLANDQQGGKCGYKNVSLQTDPPDPSNPPPPSPPCAAPGVNGTCGSFTTALGDITTDTSGFITKLFAVLLAFSGAIALLLIIRAGYTLMTSQGKPDQINQGREQLIAAIVGLMFLIFSFVILEIIGVDILRIPGMTAENNPNGSSNGNAGASCDVNANNPCGDGYSCVSNGTGNGRTGTCKANTGQSCDLAGNGGQCPVGQTCQPNGGSRSGICR